MKSNYGDRCSTKKFRRQSSVLPTVGATTFPQTTTYPTALWLNLVRFRCQASNSVEFYNCIIFLFIILGPVDRIGIDFCTL